MTIHLHIAALPSAAARLTLRHHRPYATPPLHHATPRRRAHPTLARILPIHASTSPSSSARTAHLRPAPSSSTMTPQASFTVPAPPSTAATPCTCQRRHYPFAS
ncbi:hypothetical protein B0H13DRAFT_2344107 [Mycena leptocephala]|nr:hypothetical protein B0H13DRAFT_2344107 [Mycena leptocephala]